MAHQPICPFRNDAKCMGAMCAWSRHTVNEGGMWLFTCAVASRGGSEHGLAVIDRREGSKDPVERT